MAHPDDPLAVFRALEQRHPHVFWLDAGPRAAAGSSYVGWGVPVAEEEVRAAVCVSDGSADGPQAGDYVGWAGYEDGAARAGAPTASEGMPGGAWLRIEGVHAFRHPLPAPASDVPGGVPARVARSRNSPQEYAALVERCRDAIRAGDAYQLCLTTRFEVDGDIDPVAAYLTLRQATPSHHGGFVRIGDLALLSATPERFLEVDGHRVRTHPIKGTRPRGSDAATDAALADELLASPKERAENVMIVDLMRNDLSRVCVPGSVTVERLLVVEHYPAVHQLVSTVAGVLPAGTTVGGLLDAAFPAGSMTGAPKLSAMTILHRLEAGSRGAFAGCFGWVGAAGGLDLAMIIRSIVVYPGGAYVGAGGGITWGSVPADEVAEAGVKARAPLAAVGAALPAGW